MNAVNRAAQIHCARTKRIARTASHEAWEIGLSPQHIRGRQPIRPFRLAFYRLNARPGEALAADANAVTQCFAVAEHQIEIRVRSIDDNRPGRLRGDVVEQSAAELLSKKISNSLMKIVPDSSHSVMIEQPALVNEAIETFLRSIR